MGHDIKTGFVFPSGKAIKVLISERCDENMISSSFVESLSQDAVDQEYYYYYDENFVV